MRELRPKRPAEIAEIPVDRPVGRSNADCASGGEETGGSSPAPFSTLGIEAGGFTRHAFVSAFSRLCLSGLLFGLLVHAQQVSRFGTESQQVFALGSVLLHPR